MNQVRLLEAQSRKTRAEAINTELQEPYNQALANVYGSIAGTPAVAGKAFGGIATGLGMYQGAKAVSRMIKKRKLKRYRGGSRSSRARLLKAEEAKFAIAPKIPDIRNYP
jgi:hypothetical protein